MSTKPQRGRHVRRKAPAGVALVLLVGAAPLAGQERGGIASPYVPVLEVAADAPLDAPEPPERPGALQRAVEAAGDGPLRIALAPGHHYLEPRPYREETCGNCASLHESVEATRGLRLSGRGVWLEGPAAERVVIHTSAGYGILFEDCVDCGLRNVTVTDGARDPDGRATDAAVVVKRSSVRLDRCALRDNLGDSATVADVVVGVAGVAVRESGFAWIEGCRIEGNSWDGVALYRGARAVVRDNVIDGVEAASGGAHGGGRGVGIGMTWDAEAMVQGNRVRRYWKGIGVFVDARATVRDNVVEEILTWGLTLWDAGQGRPAMWADGNVVHGTGACGAAITREAGGPPGPGHLVGNVFVRTGQDPRYDDGEPYCRQTAVARHAVPPDFPIRDNLYHANREPGGAAGPNDVDETAFRRRAGPLLRRLGLRPALQGAAILGASGRP